MFLPPLARSHLAVFDEELALVEERARQMAAAGVDAMIVQVRRQREMGGGRGMGRQGPQEAAGQAGDSICCRAQAGLAGSTKPIPGTPAWRRRLGSGAAPLHRHGTAVAAGCAPRRTWARWS